MRRVRWFGVVALFVVGCGKSGSSDQDAIDPIAAGKGGSGDGGRAQLVGGAAGTTTTGGNGGTGGVAGSGTASGGVPGGGMPGGGTPNAGSSSGDTSSAGSPYGDPMLEPDADTTPVASCAGQNDLTLCAVETTPDRAYDICVGGECVSPGCGDAACNSPAPHFQIPPSSNDTYFMSFPGPEPIVVDLVTGLGWQACIAGRSGDTCETGATTKMGWDDALAYCDALDWGGKSDWYLPDSYEVLSIVDFAIRGDLVGLNIGLDPALFPHADSPLWTSHYTRDQYVFAVQIVDVASPVGLMILTNDRTYLTPVRCARRGFSRDAGYAETRFVDSYAGAGGDERSIEDLATGLVWQGCTVGRSGAACENGATSELMATDWMAACDALEWGGRGDWRLPTYKELHSVAIYPKNMNELDPSIDEDVFYRDGTIIGGGFYGARSSLDADATMMLFDVTTGDKVGPTGKYPVICVH